MGIMRYLTAGRKRKYSARPSGGAGPVVPWYNAGGAPDPIAAYQPKGSSSLAESYVNLVNPGTHDATVGVAPTLDADGWVFNGVDQYLVTDTIPSNDITVIVRISHVVITAVSRAVFGSVDLSGNKGSAIYTGTSGDPRYIMNNGTISTGQIRVVVGASASVLATAGKKGFVNGIAAVDLMTGDSTALGVYYIGTINTSIPLPPGFSFDAKIQAIAFYVQTLTDEQVLAVSQAVAAL